ncbi:DUF4136 domain-containing protein [Lacisediminimonas profundi]|uniref:DUF4136 domain-containing protein n=1 Tax=Lacisediminimonas profundi TaxID=2603856 RepID=UPI00124B7A10|nr:DUF4136 domain-containing protein [Lacisediminimonas profundi]
MKGFLDRSWSLALVAVLTLLASGCASTIRNDVTAFHEWPADLDQRTYVITRTEEQANELEYNNYENLLRAELARLGFEEQRSAPPARLKVRLQYSSSVRDVLLIQPVADPYYYPWAWGGGPGLGPWRGPQGYYPPGVYYPGSWGPPIIQQEEIRYKMYSRQLKVVMTDARTGRNVYEVTVNSDDTKGPLPGVMPYMMRSAFQEFPGPNGVPRVIELKMEKVKPTP